jgi:hypothetical protein
VSGRLAPIPIGATRQKIAEDRARDLTAAIDEALELLRTGRPNAARLLLEQVTWLRRAEAAE